MRRKTRLKKETISRLAGRTDRPFFRLEEEQLKIERRQKCQKP